jgi:hypothetical protein
MNREPNPLFLLLSAFLLSAGLLSQEGKFFVPAIILLTLSLFLAASSLYARSATHEWTSLIPGICLALHFIALAAIARMLLPHMFWLVVVVSMLAALPKTRERGFVYLLVVAHFALGLAFLRLVEDPLVDVFIFQRDGAAAMLSGTDPYSITFENIYKEDAGFYTPGIAHDGRVWAGFPYLPVSLFLVVPGFFLGDVRFSHLAATTLTGLLMIRESRHAMGRLAAILFLFSPCTFLVVGKSWTEPLLILLLILGVSAIRRSSPVLGSCLFGSLLAVKQYVVLASPLLFLLPIARHWRFAARAASLAALLILPFALWNINDFYRAAVWWQLAYPFRIDSLSYAAAIASAGGPRISWLGFAALPLAILFVWKRCPRSLAGFLTGLALEYFAFFLFSKQAFLNYYFLVFGALCCAIVLIEPHSIPLEDRP